MELEKVGCDVLGGHLAHLVGHSMKDFRLTCVTVDERKNGSDIAATVAVVGRRPDGDELVVEPVLVAFLDELMCTTD